MAERTIIQAFGGLRTDVEPHLVKSGELVDALNVVTATGAARKRRGFAKIANAGVSPADWAYWPSLLYSFDPSGHGVDVAEAVPTPETPTTEESQSTTPPTTSNGGAWVDPGTGDDGQNNASGQINGSTPPKPQTKPLLGITIPATVYKRVAFAVTADDANAEYAGAGAILTGYARNPSTGAMTAVGLTTTPAITSGWAAGIWNGVGKITGGIAGQVLGLLLKGGGATASDTATIAEPVFQVDVPATGTLQQAFTLVLTCQAALGGAALTAYDGSGTGLTVAAKGWNGSAWEALAAPTLSGALSSGWVNGVWTGTATIADSLGYTRCKLEVVYNGAVSDDDEITLDVGAVLSVTLPATIEESETFVMSLMILDDAGNPVYEVDQEKLTVTIEAYNGSTWAVFSGLRNGESSPDFSLGWTGGLWQGNSMNVLSDGGKQQLKVTMTYDGESASDTATFVNYAAVSGIKPRQQIAGITAAWDENDPTNPEKLIDDSGTMRYSLAALKAYVNQIATNFVAGGLYTGGASAAALITGTYAGEETTTVGALVTKLLELRQTLHTASVTSAEKWEGSALHGTKSDLESRAQSDWAYVSKVSAGISASVTLEYYDGDDVNNYFNATQFLGNVTMSLPACSGTRTLALFGLCEAIVGAAFNKLGYSIHNQNTYGQIYSEQISAGGEKAVDPVMSASFPSSHQAWPSGTETLEQSVAGWKITGVFAVQTWSF